MAEGSCSLIGLAGVELVACRREEGVEGIGFAVVQVVGALLWMMVFVVGVLAVVVD